MTRTLLIKRLKLSNTLSQTKHVSQMTSLPKLLKALQSIFVNNLKDVFNKCLQENKFSDIMKKVEIIPVFKNLDQTAVIV